MNKENQIRNVSTCLTGNCFNVIQMQKYQKLNILACSGITPRPAGGLSSTLGSTDIRHSADPMTLYSLFLNPCGCQHFLPCDPIWKSQNSSDPSDILIAVTCSVTWSQPPIEMCPLRCADAAFYLNIMNIHEGERIQFVKYGLLCLSF